MGKLRHIALLIGQDLSFCREVIRGIRAYALRKSDWAIRNGPPDVRILRSLREWKPDGIIAELFHAEFARRLLRLRKPVVDTAFWLPNLKAGVVDVDHAAVGRMAAEYLLSLHLTRFAFFGSASAEYSRIRLESFRQRLREAGHEISVCHGEYLREAPTTTRWKRMESQTHRWLQQLPKPVGLFASNDVLARSLADTCSQLGLHVPDEVALLGVDDDELECLLTSPPLSSIAIPGERIGYEAAKMLDRAMADRRSGRGPALSAADPSRYAAIDRYNGHTRSGSDRRPAVHSIFCRQRGQRCQRHPSRGRRPARTGAQVPRHCRAIHAPRAAPHAN